jgi:hypothetical protein
MMVRQIWTTTEGIKTSLAWEITHSLDYLWRTFDARASPPTGPEGTGFPFLTPCGSGSTFYENRRAALSPLHLTDTHTYHTDQTVGKRPQAISSGPGTKATSNDITHLARNTRHKTESRAADETTTDTIY